MAANRIYPDFSGIYSSGANLHIFIVAYRHTMKERAINISSQACITKDNITVIVDGVLYIQVLNAKAASYGIEDYQFATTQLAQTTMRSEIGKIELDKTFEEREMINNQIVTVLDKAASENWGLKVLRYEIKDIEPPESVKDALEKQMRAERERRAVVAESEGEKQAKINVSEGERQEIINLSEAEKKKQINEAEGKAEEIKLVANATAEGIKNIAEAINEEGGVNAVNLRVAEQYIEEFGKLAKESNTLIIPSTLSDVGAMVGAFMETIKAIKPEPSGGKNS
ncbi:MAG: paraslipin [Gammaproteobacteria bacterium]|nr:paraslipin [Gammaproteobacteria bacterium]